MYALVCWLLEQLRRMFNWAYRAVRQGEKLVLILGDTSVRSHDFMLAWEASCRARQSLEIDFLRTNDGLTEFVVSGLRGASSALRVIGTDIWPMTQLRTRQMDSFTLLVRLVDAGEYNAPNRTDVLHLCWAWRRAFPQLPQAVVQSMVPWLAPGRLADEQQQLCALLRWASEEMGPSIHVVVVLCNTEKLIREWSSAIRTPERSEAVSGVARHFSTKSKFSDAGGLIVQSVRRRFQEEAERACDALYTQGAAAAVRAGASPLAAAAPYVRVLVAPVLDYQTGRYGRSFFFRELTYLAVQHTPHSAHETFGISST
ncbi:hypothetical protein AB1Y20_007551 [Prymnesium parvum]|uniref:Uncharacterized protein n=1 Tax=Prymnesium parvum TaxID=97485 RepID=A0AB34IVQ1_PRYPA